MKINDSTINKTKSLNVGASTNRPGKPAENAGVEKTNSDTDKLTLSSKAQALGKASGGTGVFDVEKVNQIKAAIANGQFVIHPERIADGLIDSVKDMISTRKG